MDGLPTPIYKKSHFEVFILRNSFSISDHVTRAVRLQNEHINEHTRSIVTHSQDDMVLSHPA